MFKFEEVSPNRIFNSSYRLIADILAPIKRKLITENYKRKKKYKKYKKSSKLTTLED